MKEPIPFAVIAHSGMTQGEFAQIVGVTRVTTNLWVKGKMRPNRYVAERVNKLLSSIAAAVDQGHLPLPPATPKHKRLESLKRVIDAH